MNTLLTTSIILIGLSTSVFAEFDPVSDGPAGWLQNQSNDSSTIIQLASNSFTDVFNTGIIGQSTTRSQGSNIASDASYTEQELGDNY